jgi:hypothetical protein
MASYVLGDEALYAYLVGPPKDETDTSKVADHAKFQAWAKSRSSQDYHYASRISVAMLRASLKRLRAFKGEPRLQELNSRLISQFKESLLEIDETVLEHWATLASSDDPALKVMSSEQMIEIATAIHTGYIYVTRMSDAIKVVQQSFTSLNIDDPWK